MKADSPTTTPLLNAWKLVRGTGLAKNETAFGRLCDAQIRRIWPGRKNPSVEVRLLFATSNGLQSAILQGRHGLKAKNGRKKPGERVGVSGYLQGLYVEDRENELLWCSPDQDRYLAEVRTMLRKARVGSLSHVNFEEPPRIVNFRLAKRCVLCGTLANGESPGRVYIKIFRRGNPALQEAILEIDDALRKHSGNRFRIPKPLAVFDGGRIVITPALALQGVHDANRCDALECAHVLARLHGLQVPETLHVHTGNDDCETVLRWTPLISRMDPEVTHLFRQLTTTLRGQAPTGGRMTIIHRDFHPGQLLNDGETAWILDWDSVSIGYPETDVATACAHAVMDQILDQASGNDVGWDGPEGMIARVTDAYRDAGGQLDPDRLRFFLGCATARVGCMLLTRGGPAEVVMLLWKLGYELSAGDRTLP